MYVNGRGVPQDYVEAFKWFNLAGVKGEEQASRLRDAVAEQMTPAQIAEARRLARAWLESHGNEAAK